MNTKNVEGCGAVAGQVERPVGPLARMTMSEEAWMLRNPYALRLLMDYHDQDRAQAESIMDADELGPWPSARFTALYERGRSIMAEDLDCWDADLLRAFGFPERPKHEARTNPALVVERSVCSVLDMPPLGTVMNREAVIFDGAPPMLAEGPNSEVSG